jgi:hypothetical protein
MDKTPTGRFAASAEEIRAAARWLLTAAAGLLAALVAGLQIRGLNGLPAWRVVVALIGAAVAIAAVGSVASGAARLLAAEWPTLTYLGAQEVAQQLRPPNTRASRERAADLRDVVKSIVENREELYRAQAETIPDLHRRLAASNSDMRADAGGPASAALAARAAALRAAADNVVDFANYQLTRARFERLRRHLLLAGIPVVAGVVVFTLATGTGSR